MKYQVQNNHITDLRNSERKLRLDRFLRNGINQENDWVNLFDFDEWDRQLFIDARLGKLDSLIERAKKDYEQGNTEPLP